jgi:hypothetical protein
MQTEEDILFEKLGHSDSLHDFHGEESLLDAPEVCGLQVIHDDDEMLI